jgi:hypothetical protein
MSETMAEEVKKDDAEHGRSSVSEIARLPGKKCTPRGLPCLDSVQSCPSLAQVSHVLYSMDREADPNDYESE